MRHTVSAVCLVLLVFAADLALAQAGQLCLFSDPQGVNCSIHDAAPGLLQVHVIHTQAGGVTGVQFSAPKPGCMNGATWLSDTLPFPITLGNSQTGLTVPYGSCLPSPIHVVTINYFATGMTTSDCPYEILPHPSYGRIVVADCAGGELDGQGSTTFINSNLPCTCNLAGTPQLFVTPTNLDFGPTNVAKFFLIGNSGGGTLTWTVSESIPWLSVSRLSGTGSATINVTVDRSSFPTGSYSGLIEISSNGGNATVSVTMEVFAEPVLGVSPSQLHFSPATPNGALSIWNSGGGTLQWTIVSDQPWLSVAPASGTGSATIDVTVDRSSLPNGSYSGSIGITSNGGNATVSVTMEVVAGTILGVSPSELHFPATTSNGALSIWNAGAGALYWSISSDQPWLTVVPASGIGADQVAVYVERQGLSPGTYHGNLTVTSNGGNATIPVEMIASDVILIVNPNLLIFTPSTPTHTFSISNGGTGTLEWTLDLLDPWVSASPLSGTGSGVVTVNVDVGSLPCCNMLLGQIRVNSNGGSEVIELRAYPTGPGTGGSIGIYADVAGTECNLSGAVVGMTTYHVVHLADFGVTACAYWAPKPSCFAATYLSDTNVFPVTIGDSQAGVSIGYGSCRPGPIHVQSIVFMTNGNTPQCCLYPILGIPTSGNVEAVDCANNLITAYGVTSVINPTGTCNCGSVRVEESTWGRVKSLYAE